MGTATTGTVTTDGTTVTGTIEHCGFFDRTARIVLFPSDKDWFKVTLTAGTTYQIDLEGASTRSGGIHDAALGGIFNSSGNTRVHSGDSDSGELFNARITFTHNTSGDYFIEVTAPEFQGPHNTGKGLARVLKTPRSEGTFLVAQNLREIDWARIRNRFRRSRNDLINKTRGQSVALPTSGLNAAQTRNRFANTEVSAGFWL